MVSVLAGCKKSGGSNRTSIHTNPFQGFVNEKGLLPVELAKTSPQTMEIGYEFTVIRNQKVVKLGAMMPDAGTYTVTLWNADDESVVVSAPVTVNAMEFGYVDIKNVNVEPRVNYVLSINTTNQSQPSSYFAQKIADEPYPLYPIQMGIMTIQQLVTRVTDTPKFPYTPLNDFQYYLMGIPDIYFQ